MHEKEGATWEFFKDGANIGTELDCPRGNIMVAVFYYSASHVALLSVG